MCQTIKLLYQGCTCVILSTKTHFPIFCLLEVFPLLKFVGWSVGIVQGKSLFKVPNKARYSFIYFLLGKISHCEDPCFIPWVTTLKLARYASVVFMENFMHEISQSYQLFNCVSKQFWKIKSTMGLLWWDIWRRTCASVGIFWHASDFCNFPNLQIKHQICNKNLNLYVQTNSIKSR